MMAPMIYVYTFYIPEIDFCIESISPDKIQAKQEFCYGLRSNLADSAWALVPDVMERLEAEFALHGNAQIEHLKATFCLFTQTHKSTSVTQ